MWNKQGSSGISDNATSEQFHVTSRRSEGYVRHVSSTTGISFTTASWTNNSNNRSWILTHSQVQAWKLIALQIPVLRLFLWYRLIAIDFENHNLTLTKFGTAVRHVRIRFIDQQKFFSEVEAVCRGTTSLLVYIYIYTYIYIYIYI